MSRGAAGRGGALLPLQQLVDSPALPPAHAGAAPSRKHKSKHQIGSLYHQAKLAELQDLETRASSAKTKAESKRKYGW